MSRRRHRLCNTAFGARGLVLWAGVILLPACIGEPEPLSPEAALDGAARAIGEVLREEAARTRSPAAEPAAPADDPHVLSLWYYDHPILSALGDGNRATAFEKTHPSLRLKTQYIGDWGVAVQKLTVSLAAGDMPDVAVVKRSWLARLIPSGRLTPLDTLLPPSLIDDLRPSSREAFTWEGRLYGWPADGFCSVLYVNADRLGDGAPETWEDLYAVARKLRDAQTDEGSYPLGHFPYLEALWAAGGEVVDGSSSGLDSPEAREALDYILRLRDEGLIHPRALEDEYIGFELFLRGRVALTVASSARLPETARLPFPVRIGPVPGKEGPVSRLSDNAVVVFRRYADAKQSALVELLDYLTGPEMMGADAALRGSVPVRQSVVETMKVPAGLASAYDVARGTSLTPVWSEVEAILGRYLSRAYRWSPDPAR